MPVRYIAILCVAVALGACGSDSQDEVAEAPRPSVIGDPLQRSLERAEAVQDTVDQRASELRQRLEESED